MSKLIENILEKIPVDTVNDNTLTQMIQGSPDRQYGLVKRAIAKGELIHIRRGLYVLEKKYQRRGINLFELAQQIYGPSYVSFESALSYHGWIPEAVYTITNAAAKRSKEYRTPLGAFVYTHVPTAPFYSGVERIEEPKGIFLMATPWKALTDYIYANKKDWKSIEPLMKDLRIEEDCLKQTDLRLLEELKESYASIRVKKFIQGVLKDLKP